MGFAGGWTNTVGDDVVAAFEVRGEHAAVSGEMSAEAWHGASSLRERHYRGGKLQAPYMSSKKPWSIAISSTVLT